MTVYYVNFVDGLDANNGLGPDASHATNKPFKTLTKLLGAAGMASGDTAYLAPVAFREVVTVAMTSATATTSIIGDPANAQGFKTAAGVLLPAGDVVWSAFTTNDATTPSATVLLGLAGRDFLSFSKIAFIGGSPSPSCVNGNTSNPTDITFTDCVFIAGTTGTNAIEFTGIDGAAQNWLIDRCVIVVGRNGSCVAGTLNTQTGADLNANITIKNSLLMCGDGGNPARFFATGAGANFAGGINLISCTVYGGSTGFALATAAKFSTSIPSTAYNNVFFGQTTGISAATAGQIVEDYNRIAAGTARSNVTAGANSQAATAYALLLEIGQSFLFGRMPRPFLSPMVGSTLLGFGNQSGAPTVDLLNRPRPAGGGSATTAAAATGTATAGAGSTLTNSGASFTVNAYAGYTLRLTGGTGSGQQRYITSNTSTVITVSTAWTTNPDATTTYTIDNPGSYAGIGYAERHDSAIQETTTTQAGGSAVKIIGPGDHEFQIPVDASSTSLTVYARYDTLHGTTNKPQAILVANGAIGVVTETKTMTVGVDTWEQLSFSSFTPSAKGFVTVRLVSRAAAGNGIAYFDTAAGGATSTGGFDYFRQTEPIGTIVVGGSGGGLKNHPGMDGGMRG